MKAANDQPRFPHLDIKWAAGFFEGEGNARLRKGNLPKYSILAIVVDQVRRDPLDAFCEIVGAGKVRGPYGPYGSNKQQYYQYAVTGQASIAVAEQLIPYLVCKREQVEKALALYQEVLDAKLAA